MQNAPETPLASPELPAPGDVLAGKYRVERVVGAGAMGIVVAATHIQLEERVALKFMRREVMSPETIARFLREARAAAKIKSEHVARVTDVGTLASGAPYMVMEFLEGRDLGQVVRERGPLPVQEAVEYVLEACEAVAEAHSLGIVHRDLKPANLFLARRPGGQQTVKVVDFGISKIVARAGSKPPEDVAMTRTTTWLGSPLYMSPEQMRSARDVDARTDIWSLGLILFELLAGRVPFDATSFPELCAEVLHEEPAPLARFRPDAPPGLGAVVQRCLRKSADDRYANVAELALALGAFAPERARERIERIVSVLEAAGMMRPSGAPSLGLDATQPAGERPSSLPPPRPAAVTGDAVEVPIPLVTAGHEEPARASGASRSGGGAPGRRRRGKAIALILGAVLALGGSGAYVGLRAGYWSLASLRARVAPAAAPPAVNADAPTPATSAAPPATAIASSAAPPASVAPPIPSDAGVDAPVAPPATSASAAGRRRAPARPESPSGRAPPPPPEDAPPANVTPDLTVERCFQTLPDGSRKSIPCH